MSSPHLHPRLPLPRWNITHKCGEILDTDNPLAWDVAEPIFTAGINQVAILNRKNFVRTEPYIRPESHLLALQIQGETGFSVDEKITWLKAGDFAFVPANTHFIHTGKPRGTFSYVYITIADNERWQGLKNRGHWIRTYESADFLYLLVRRLLDAQVNRSVVSINHALRDAYTLVELLMRETQVSTNQGGATSSALRKLLGQIRENPGKKWNNDEMAASMNMSERTFLRAFTKEFGTTPKSMVIKQRIIIARQLLALTDAPIKKIARELGYDSRRTFSALFSESVGISPDEFRRKSETEEI